MSYVERAACRVAVLNGEATLDDWFPKGYSAGRMSERPSVQRAIAICGGCEVQGACLDDFLERFPAPAVQYGIIAGRIYHGGYKPDGRRRYSAPRAPRVERDTERRPAGLMTCPHCHAPFETFVEMLTHAQRCAA